MGGDDNKEKKRRKQMHRMSKIVAKAWGLDGAKPFQEDPYEHTALHSLSAVGKKIDQGGYRLGRSGWEDFAGDLGGVYNRHVHRKTKHARIAGEHCKFVGNLLAEKDPSLSEIAAKHMPTEAPAPESDQNRKRKATENGRKSEKKTKTMPNSRFMSAKRKMGPDLTLGDREDNAMVSLFEFIESKGGSRESVANFRCRVTRKPSDGRYDTNYYNEQGRRFRSMLEVGRYLNLVLTAPNATVARKTKALKSRKVTTGTIEAEKRRLRKEMDKLRKQHTRATKALDDFTTDEKEVPEEDLLVSRTPQQDITPTNCAAARIPDVSGFAGVPNHCVPDVLMAWDFLCTFSRALHLQPIGLDDFVHALSYRAPKNLSESDQFNFAPVYIAEAHLGLLKLLLTDTTSDDWWWSILETDAPGEPGYNDPLIEKDESELPLIKVDVAGMLGETEDPLLTTSWLQNLDEVRGVSSDATDAMKASIRTAMDVTSNKWVRGFLRKSIKLGKTSGSGFMKRAVVWLLDLFRDGRADLYDRSISKNAFYKRRAKVVDETMQLMNKLSAAVMTVGDDDVGSDVEDSEDDSDDEDEGGEDAKKDEMDVESKVENMDDQPASAIPVKPPPSLVDLLLPPSKPLPNVELINSFTWSHIAGATACRVLHRFKRLRNEVDDKIRKSRELPKLTVAERRQRESKAVSRIFTESVVVDGDVESPTFKAMDHLCSGGDYLKLSILERICLLRVLIEAAYDSRIVYELVDQNHKQRTNAVKALDSEQKRARKEAKEKALQDEANARQDLAFEARRSFLEEKREEIRKSNEKSQDFTEQEIDALTEEEILDFDEDIRADYDTLPNPESFKKTVVMERVARLQEAGAFETESLFVFNMKELLERDKQVVASLKEQLTALRGDEEESDEQNLGREAIRALERTRRELERLESNADSLQQQREAAIETVKDAMTEGTVKSLKNALRIAKAARLFGIDEDTNGVWTLDIIRDAHMELENAKHLKRVADAEKDLVSKLNKCFIRTEPMGRDRFRNRFWHFENSERGHIWVEVDYSLKEESPEPKNYDGCVPLVLPARDIAIGAEDEESDFLPSGPVADTLRAFSRREYHRTGIINRLAKRYWGCHVTESTLRRVIKNLDDRGEREESLRKNLKKALEEKATHQDHSASLHEEDSDSNNENNEHAEEDAVGDGDVKNDGDEAAFAETIRSISPDESDVVDSRLYETLTTGIGSNVRVRFIVDTHKDHDVAQYQNAKVIGWKTRREIEKLQPDGDEFDPATRVVHIPVWQALTDRGNKSWLTGFELIESICRYHAWSNNDNGSYLEQDASFLAYRNGIGRHCGKATDAGNSFTPHRFGQLMLKREAELYAKLKRRIFDDNWGGKNAPRNAWISSMKDYAYDLVTVREGLLTLETAFFELMGGVHDESTMSIERGKELLSDSVARNDIELESIEKNVSGLWNSEDSRSVFLAITSDAKSVGFLALGLELLHRNTRAYLEANKVTRGQDHYVEQVPMRTTRRMNAWQQANNHVDPF